MKKIFFFFLITATFSIVGCKDDEQPTDFMTATIDGESFEASIHNDIVDDDLDERMITIVGIDERSSSGIALTIPASINIGFYEIPESNITIDFINNIGGYDNFITEGTVEITRSDKPQNIIEGTFNFTAAYDFDETVMYNINDGEFKGTYQ